MLSFPFARLGKNSAEREHNTCFEKLTLLETHTQKKLALHYQDAIRPFLGITGRRYPRYLCIPLGTMVYAQNYVGVRHFSTRHKTEGDETPVTYLMRELQRSSKHCTATFFRGLNGEEREGNPVSEEK